MATASEREILAALQEALGGELEPSAPITGLGLDSLRLAQLARDLESRFDIPIDPELFDVETVGDLLQYIRERR